MQKSFLLGIMFFTTCCANINASVLNQTPKTSLAEYRLSRNSSTTSPIQLPTGGNSPYTPTTAEQEHGDTDITTPRDQSSTITPTTHVMAAALSLIVTQTPPRPKTPPTARASRQNSTCSAPSTVALYNEDSQKTPFRYLKVQGINGQTILVRYVSSQSSLADVIAFNLQTLIDQGMLQENSPYSIFSTNGRTLIPTQQANGIAFVRLQQRTLSPLDEALLDIESESDTTPPEATAAQHSDDSEASDNEDGGDRWFR